MIEEGELVEAFGLAWTAGRGVVPPPGIGPRLVALCAEASSRFPELAAILDGRELVSAIARHTPVDAQPYVDRCRGDELALALAAGRGEPLAIAALEHGYRAAIESTCRRFATSHETPDDLRQVLRERLFVGPKPKILEYGGHGLLNNWLRITAIRLFLDRAKRKDRPREVLAFDSEELGLPDPADLGLELIKREYRAMVTEAIHEAARRLSIGDRHLLRSSLVAGLSLEELAASLGVHRATAARRLARAKDQLVAGTRGILRERLDTSAADLDEMLGIVASRLDLSASRLLASTSRPTK